MIDRRVWQVIAGLAVGLLAVAMIVGCSNDRASDAQKGSTTPSTLPATAPAPLTTAVTHVPHGHHQGTSMANGCVAFGDYFIRMPTQMNGVNAGADGLSCESARVVKLLQIAIFKREDAAAPVPKLVTRRRIDDPQHSVLVAPETEISQVRIGDFSFTRGLSTLKDRHLKVATLVAADDDNDIIIHAVAENDENFTDLLECISTFKYASPRGEDKPSKQNASSSREEVVPVAGTLPAALVAVPNLRINLDRHEDVTFGPTGCPVIVAGGNVWNVQTGKTQSVLQGKIETYTVSALSNDGKYFASGMKSRNQQDTPVAVWSTETGKRLFEVPGVAKRFVDAILFSTDKYLMLGGRSTSDLQVWDIEQNKQLKSIDIKAERLDHGKVAFSPNGEYFVAVAEKKLTLFRTSDSKIMAVMSFPRNMSSHLAVPAESENGDPASATTNGLPVSGDAFDAVFIYAWMQDIKFSPDGREIAAISTHPIPRLIVWDVSGKLLFDEPLMVPSRAFWEHSLQWLPDKSGWLASGYIVDRATQKPVFGFNKQFAVDQHIWAINAEQLLVNSGGKSPQLECVSVPWKHIRHSLLLMKDPNAGLLSPLNPVSIKTVLGDQPAGGAEAVASIVEALRRRLYQDGIMVREGCDTVFTLRVSEKAGDTLPIYERQSPFDLRGKDTGRKATERLGTLVVELTTKGKAALLWREKLVGTSSRSFSEEINDATMRKSLMESLSRELSELPMPYFIPKDDKELALPVVHE